MYNNEIETKSLGRMRVLANIKDIALIEKLYDSPEKYIVGVGFNKKTNSWSFGIYHNDLPKALNSFNKTVSLKMNVATPEEIKTEQLNKALYILENVKDEYNISDGYDQFLKYAIGLDEKEIENYNNFAWDLDREYSSPKDFIVAQLKNSKEKSENEIENIDIELSKFETDAEIEKMLENKMQNNTLNKDEMKKIYEEIEKMMQDLKEDFEMITENDSNLIEHFKDTSSKDTFSSIMVAGTILGGIELRNLQRENGKLDGEKEVFPYNKEQIKLIDRYNKLQETIDKMEQYAEQNLNCDEDMEM